jgi:flagellar M-ring protein FliF
MVVVAFAVRPAIRRAGTALATRAPGKSPSRELAAAVASQATLSAPEPAPTDPERLRNQEIFEQVRGHLKREPTQSSRLLQSWIHSD